MTAELVCIGLATLDTVVALPSWPERDERVVVEELVRAGGGTAATAAVAAARLGRSVALIGSVGSDDVGLRVRRDLAQAGVDTSHLVEQPGRSAESIVLVERESATRTILHSPGVGLTVLAGAARAAAEGAVWVHVDHAGWQLGATLPRSRLSVDAGNLITGLELDGLGLYAPTVGALRQRYPGLQPLAGIARALREGASRVAVTLGADGAVAAEGERAWRVAPASLDIVSTLGAGDVFHGALLGALLEGRELPDALRLANVAAALSCGAVDARSAIPSRSELEAALRRAPPVEQVRLEGAR